MNILIYILTAVHVLVALFLIVLVLAQKSKDQGVGAAFGGGVAESVFGGSTTPLVRMTIWCGCILLVTTLSLAILHSHRSGASGSLMERVLQTPAPAPSSSPITLPTTVPVTTPTTPAAPIGPEATTPESPASTGSATPEPVAITPPSTAEPTEQKP